MYFINVILTTDNTVQENFLFIGLDEKKVVKEAEEKFLEIARKLQPDMTQEDEESYLDDGFCEDGEGILQVCINHPTVIENCYTFKQVRPRK